jgi:archaemetzincin
LAAAMHKRPAFFVVIIFVLTLLLSCRQKNNEVQQPLITLAVQPFENISSEEVQYMYAALKKIIPSAKLIKPLPLPKQAFYATRNRYRADSLIKFLGSLTDKQHVIIGLTDKDISTTKNGVADWGVMGLGYCPGNACVASTFRLSAKEKKEQLFKVAIHELGHTQGLPHCETKTCFMRDAEGRNPTNEEKEFCGPCRQRLFKKGWIVN